MNDVISAGADEIISRTELLTLSAKELSENIAKWVQRKRESEKNKVNAHITYDSGIRTQALKEIFHEEVLESIIVQCAQEMNYFDVKALQAGYSGAAVFRIKASKDPNFSDGVYLVAKISRSNFSLEDELKRRPKPGSHFDATSAAPHSQPIIHSSGLYAIFIPEVRQMMILRDFLNQPLKNKDSAILNRVVQDLLVVPAKEAKPWKDFDVDDSAYQFKVSACSEVADFLSDAATWKTILEPRDLHAIKIVQQIVTLMIEKKWGFTVADRHAARLHGDFHCKNVFLAPGDGPVLIDFGRSDIYPRLFDFAALDTDLILSVMDSGKGGDHAYTNTEKWMRRVTKSFPFVQKKTPKQPNTRIELLRTTLLAQMTSKLKSVSPSEYGEVLIFHMLRYLRFQNIPSAKKILAVHIIAKLAKQLGLLQQI